MSKELNNIRDKLAVKDIQIVSLVERVRILEVQVQTGNRMPRRYKFYRLLEAITR